MLYPFSFRRFNHANPYFFSFFLFGILCFSGYKLAAQQNLSNGVAISGYDPVAYFASSKAIKGSKEYSIQLQGATYYFSSLQNLETFKKQPEKYTPQYGGWCAYAMGAKGEKVEVDPGTFKITDGKLYLFYNKFFTNTLNSWNADENNLRAKADINWKKLTK